MTVSMLKKSWYVPAATARLNSFFLLMKPRETIVLVIVVPMLAPMIIGTAPCNVIEPEATRATTSEVVVELLCNIAVIRSPMNKPVNGLEVANKMVSATFLPKCCRDDVIRSRENKNKINAPRIYTPMRTLDHMFFFGSVIGACSNFLFG